MKTRAVAGPFCRVSVVTGFFFHPGHRGLHVLLFTQRRHTSQNGGRTSDELSTFTHKPINIRAAEARDGTIYTLEEYLEREEKLQDQKHSIMANALHATDNPRWILFALALVGMAVGSFVVSSRIRREQRLFDPKLRQVRVLDAPDGPAIGGPFRLVSVADESIVTDKDLLGKWLYIYFGFTNCPDICPQEMSKMTRLITQLDKRVGREYWQPIFISLDPHRDTPDAVRTYLSDYHGRILGLTGTADAVEDAARAYRVYFSIPDAFSPPNEKQKNVAEADADYLIDHSIVMYLVDPSGKFNDYTTKEFTWVECYTKLLRRMVDYEKRQLEEGNEAANVRIAKLDRRREEG